MPKKQEELNNDLFQLLKIKGYNPIPFTSDGKQVPTPYEADVFQFRFTKDDKDYGPVTVTVDGSNDLGVYYSADVAASPKSSTGPDGVGSSGGDPTWYQLLKQLKVFAKNHQLGFDLKDQDNLKYDMAKREHTKKLDEGYHAINKKASYNDNIAEVKMVIKHKRDMQEGEQRFRQIDRIFIENVEGERFLAPTNKPGLARVYARHIAEGGKANDERWNHIGSICEEYTQMAGFVRATKNNQFNESAQKLVNEGINHYVSLRETLHKLAGKKGYNNYFESYTPQLMEDESQIDLSEMFMSSSLDPRIESVMPILSKLSKNISEDSSKEIIALEEWADSIIEADEGIVSNNPGGIPESTDDDLDDHQNRVEWLMGAPHFLKRDEATETAYYSKDDPEWWEGSQWEDEEVTEGMEGQTVFSGTGDDGGKYEIIQTGPTDFMIHANGKHIDTYSSLARAMSVLKNEVSGLKKDVAEGGIDTSNMPLVSLGGTVAARPAVKIDSLVKAQGLDGVWRVNSIRGDSANITMERPNTGKSTNIPMSALRVWSNKPITQEQGVAEDLDANQKRVGQLGPTEKITKKNPLRGKLVGANENFIGMAPQAVAEGQEDLDTIRRLVGK